MSAPVISAPAYCSIPTAQTWERGEGPVRISRRTGKVIRITHRW